MQFNSIQQVMGQINIYMEEKRPLIITSYHKQNNMKWVTELIKSKTDIIFLEDNIGNYLHNLEEGRYFFVRSKK